MNRVLLFDFFLTTMLALGGQTVPVIIVALLLSYFGLAFSPFHPSLFFIAVGAAAVATVLRGPGPPLNLPRAVGLVGVEYLLCFILPEYMKLHLLLVVILLWDIASNNPSTRAVIAKTCITWLSYIVMTQSDWDAIIYVCGAATVALWYTNKEEEEEEVEKKKE